MLDHIKAQVAEAINALTLPTHARLVSLVIALPRAPAGAPQLPGAQFQFLHTHRDELRAGYGSAAEWQADGARRLQRLAAVAQGLTRDWYRADPGKTGFDGFAMLGFAAVADASARVDDQLPNALLWVPEIGLHSREGKAALILSAALPTTPETLRKRWDAALARLVPRLYTPIAGPRMAAGLRRDFDEPDRGGWGGLVDDALKRIADGALEKVVLSRRLDVTGKRYFDVGRLLGALACLFPSCQIVNLRRKESSFISATPERLLSKQGLRLEVDAIAGTATRAETTELDAQLAEALRSSDKNLREHRLVVRAIAEALAPYCKRIQTPDEPRLLRLSNAQHLWSPIQADLQAGANLFELAEHLHPTPATNGAPRRQAHEWLRNGEPFVRGWYTGAAGVLEPDLSGELWVLLRCARICGDRAELYAGAGIVAGSDPQSEWDETEAKLGAILSALQYA